jgi:hypothetical protein
MPRKPRKLSSTGIYHIMTRGIDRMAIFHDDEDREKYLEILASCLSGEQSSGSNGDGCFCHTEGRTEEPSSMRGCALVEDDSLVPTSCNKGDRPQPTARPQIAPLPVDATHEQLWDYICADAPEIHPFTERVLDGEAEELLLKFSGLKRPTDIVRLTRQQQIILFYRLQEEGVSIQQMSRLTGIAKTNITRWLS